MNIIIVKAPNSDTEFHSLYHGHDWHLIILYFFGAYNSILIIHSKSFGTPRKSEIEWQNRDNEIRGSRIKLYLVGKAMIQCSKLFHKVSEAGGGGIRINGAGS